MRSGLRNAEGKLEPGGDGSERATSCGATDGTTTVAVFAGAGRSAARFAPSIGVAVSANAASQSYAGTADTTDAATVPAPVSESPLP